MLSQRGTRSLAVRYFHGNLEQELGRRKPACFSVKPGCRGSGFSDSERRAFKESSETRRLAYLPLVLATGQAVGIGVALAEDLRSVNKHRFSQS